MLDQERDRIYVQVMNPASLNRLTVKVVSIPAQ